MAIDQDEFDKREENSFGDIQGMHERTTTQKMMIMLSRDNVKRVSRYIIREGSIEIVEVTRIGGYWTMTLANVRKDARADICKLIGLDDLGAGTDTTTPPNPSEFDESDVDETL